jgi:glycosyltransferase involved in cell wall biosynthesis
VDDTIKKEKMCCDQRSCPDWTRCSDYALSGYMDLCSALEKEHHMFKSGDFVKGQVDVIIPAYNCRKYIEAALESVFEQTWPREKLSVVVVDDGSTDGTSKVVEDMDIPKSINFTLVTKKENLGANSARNSGLALCSGEFVFIMDADSILSSDALEVLAYNLSSKADEVGYAYCCFNRLWEAQGSFLMDPWSPPDFNAELLKQNNYISMMSLVRRKAIPNNGFDTSIKRFQDWDMWLTMLEKGIVGVKVNESLFNAYVLQDGISKDQKTIKGLQEVVLRKHGLM